MNDNITDVNYCCIDHLIEEAFDKLDFRSNEYRSVAFVLDQYYIMDFVKTIITNETYGDSFEFAMFEVDNVEYNDFYYLTITNEFDIWCEKAKMYKNEYHDDGYIFTDADCIYIQDDCPSKILKDLDFDDNKIIIFGINE